MMRFKLPIRTVRDLEILLGALYLVGIVAFPAQSPHRFRKRLLAMSDDALGAFSEAVRRLAGALRGLCDLPVEIEAEVPDVGALPPGEG
jgi:hypothetical protein